MSAQNDKVTSDRIAAPMDIGALDVTAGQLARLLSRSSGTITYWAERRGLPRTTGGLYNVKTALLWLEQHYRQSKTRTVGGTGLTEQDLARLFGVTRQTVFAWRKRGLPRAVDGTYSLGQVCRWLRCFYQRIAEAEYEERLDVMRRKVTRNAAQLQSFLEDGKSK